jgi:hypothetical protein
MRPFGRCEIDNDWRRVDDAPQWLLARAMQRAAQIVFSMPLLLGD